MQKMQEIDNLGDNLSLSKALKKKNKMRDD